MRNTSIIRWNWPIPNLGRLWHIQPFVHPPDSVWEEKDDGLHGQIRHQPQEHPQLTAQELYKGENWRRKNLTASHFHIKFQVNIISMAKDFSTYFSRIYPVASNDQEVLISLCLDGTLLFLLWCFTHHQNTRMTSSSCWSFLQLLQFYVIILILIIIRLTSSTWPSPTQGWSWSVGRRVCPQIISR